MLLIAACRVALGGTIILPWTAQKTASECGRAVLAMLAARRGGDVDEMYRLLPAPPDPVHGYSIAEMQRFGADIGVTLTVEAPAGVAIAGECSPRPPVSAHLARLAALLEAGHPIVVPVVHGAERGHYLIMVGTAKDGFVVLDPARRGAYPVQTSQLATLMCGFGYVALISR